MNKTTRPTNYRPTGQRGADTMVNRVFLMGNLGADAETLELDNRAKRTTFQLATNRFWKNDGGETEQSTTWHRVVAFGALVKFAGTLEKGQLVHIEGRLDTRTYEKDDETRYFTQVIAERIQATGKKEAR